MITLSVKQPWAWLICSGIKDIENRTWKLPEKMNGKRVLIHASAKPAVKWSRINFKYPLDCLSREQKTSLGDKANRYGEGLDQFKIRRNGVLEEQYITSAIIGSVEIVGCVVNHESIWAEKIHYKFSENPNKPNEFAIPDGKVIWNWVLANPILFDKPILNVKGKLNFWESNYEQIECPQCKTIQLHNNSDIGVPGWGNPVHTCEKCGYDILESEF